jgi:diguanylate cyclase (GGDEF)-like protein
VPLNPLYSALLLTTAIISAVMTAITWNRRKQASSAPPMALFGLAMTWWCLAYAIHWSSIYQPSEFFWLDLTYVGAVIVPVAFLAFAFSFTDRNHWLSHPVIALLSIEPIITLLFLFTDQRFGIFFGGNRQVGSSVILSGGFGFWFHVLYSYALIMVGFMRILRAHMRAPLIYRKQTRMILVGAAIPWFINIIMIFGTNPLPDLDLTPLAFVLTGVTFTYGIFRYGFLDIVPIARNLLVEKMPDGVLVLDKKNRLADINPTAMKLLGIGPPPPIGQPIETVISHLNDLLPRYLDMLEGQDEIMVSDPLPSFFDVRINSLTDRHGNFYGRLISFRDITRRKENELELRRASQRLQLKISEIEALQVKLKEQAIRDHLTGLYNRRYLQEALESELHRAKRDSLPLSLVLMDIDRFKNCNDSYGHKAGDLVLQALADMLTDTTRKEDIICRYGGEEFLVVLPGTLAEVARERTELWRQKFQELCVLFDDVEISTTLSAGIACFPVDGDSMDRLLTVADNALYKAKQTGRNRVV